MTQQTYLDPFAMWKSVYEKTESKWNEVLHETMQKEAFSEWMGQVQNAFLQYQELVQTTTENYLKQVNMPTRDEISNVASLIINLEEKVDNLDQKIDDEILGNSQAAELNNLKISIAKLDQKMDGILKAFQQLAAQEASTSPVVENKKSAPTSDNKKAASQAESKK